MGILFIKSSWNNFLGLRYSESLRRIGVYSLDLSGKKYGLGEDDWKRKHKIEVPGFESEEERERQLANKWHVNLKLDPRRGNVHIDGDFLDYKKGVEMPEYPALEELSDIFLPWRVVEPGTYKDILPGLVKGVRKER